MHKESMCETQSWMSTIIEKQESENKKAAIDSAAVQHNQEHQKRQLQQTQQQQQQSNTADGPRETEETYRVSDRQLKSLSANEALRRALGDSELCELLEKIDSAKDRERTLDEALDTNPDFAAFINTMLQSIGVRDIEGNCTLR